ncbi:MAG TPA: OsmC family protein [Mycobacterium sp.]|jgi:organic hydroperoxide reductase OsmC/OhrA|nr:OsmC family protein [Mycobacterium sp.]
MAVIRAQFRNLAGTEASVGTTDGKSVVVDRPPGKAGGQGLGFNGGQLLALAIGGCLCNDLQYAAHAGDITLGAFGLSVDVEISDSGDVTAVNVEVQPLADNRDRIDRVLEGAVARSTVRNAVRNGVPLTVQ